MDIKPYVAKAKKIYAKAKQHTKTFIAWAEVKLKAFSGWLGNILIKYSGNADQTEAITEDYYVKWREEKEKRVRLEAELAEEKRKH
jgi:hypothetical protein